MPSILYGLQPIVEQRQVTVCADMTCAPGYITVHAGDAAACRPGGSVIRTHRHLLETSIAMVSARMPAVRRHMSAFCHKFVGQGFQCIASYTIAR
jgi:hypothetical protein